VWKAAEPILGYSGKNTCLVQKKRTWLCKPCSTKENLIDDSKEKFN
jgi:hypothetical protein